MPLAVLALPAPALASGPLGALLPLRQGAADLRSCLLALHARSEVELEQMDADTCRNTVIAELDGAAMGSATALAQVDDMELVARCTALSQLRPTLPRNACEGEGTSEGLPHTAWLWSHPGSGNTWVRVLVESGSGLFTGSEYDDLDLGKLFLREAEPWSDHLEQKILVKTHAFGGQLPADSSQVNRAVMLVRDPYAAILAEYMRLQTNSHTGRKEHVKDEFGSYAEGVAVKWTETIMQQRAYTGEQLWLRYEDLQANGTTVLQQIAAFCGVTISAQRAMCAIRHSQSVHREHAISVREAYCVDRFEGVASRIWETVRALAEDYGYQPVRCDETPPTLRRQLQLQEKSYTLQRLLLTGPPSPCRVEGSSASQATPSRVAWLWDHPGSGNTWLRAILELATELKTGSEYDDIDLRDLFRAESQAARQSLDGLITVTTHGQGGALPEGFNIHSAFILHRDPYAAMLAEYMRRNTGSHTRRSEAVGDDFEDFVRQAAVEWAATVEAQLQYSGDHVLVKFADVNARKVQEMAAFCNVTVSPERAACAIKLAKPLRPAPDRDGDEVTPRAAFCSEVAKASQLARHVWDAVGRTAQTLGYEELAC